MLYSFKADCNAAEDERTPGCGHVPATGLKIPEEIA